MQQHPIPQNITGFEFKLIGDMTVKQFAYLAGGAVITYIIFISPLYPLVKYPLVIFLPLFSIALAFIPIEGRPLDRWISNFIRALFTPSQYMFHKKGAVPEFLQTYTSQKVVPKSVPVNPVLAKGTVQQPRNEKFTTYLQTVTEPAINEDIKEKERLEAIKQAFYTTTQVVAPQPSRPPAASTIPIAQTAPASPASTQPIVIARPNLQPQVGFMNPTAKQGIDEEASRNRLANEILDEESHLEEENKKLKAKLEYLRNAAMSEPNQTTQIASPDQIRQQALAIEKKLQEALSEKERLESELAKLRSTTSIPTQAVTPTVVPMPKQAENVRVVPPKLAVSSGVAGFSQYPNIISGIVKDAKGEVLPNIIVEVKDATGNPVRAFKTNKLGQFSGATSLATGKYTIELEDPKNTFTFDVIGIELKGAFFPPLEILAKDQAKVQATNERQQLYHSLFGQGQTASS